MAAFRSRRLEAYPFEWSALTSRQKEAVEFVSELLVDALDGLSKAPATGSEFDFDRRSQLAFVDGDRGTGKSSVLLAVQHLTSEDKANTEEFPEALQRLWARRHQLVWLATLDMEPMARPANLLAAILARIGERVEYPARRAPGRMAAAFDELDEPEKAASDLQALEVDAVLAWRGTDPQRSLRAEPTAYAAEVMASERAGLRLAPRFDAVLGAFSKLLAPDKGPERMFVIPVDDFDLAPTRCLELLRIIRMVTSPRLFFLIAGNTRIAETVLRLQSEGDLATLAGQAFEILETRAVLLTSMEIAANNLRKLLPPSQRVQLAEASVEEALNFRPAPGAPTLREALEGIKFDRNNAPPDRATTSLSAFLFFEDPLGPERYSGVRWLGGTPRQLLDRTATLVDFIGTLKDYGRALLQRLAEDLVREAREHPSIERDHRERLARLLDATGTPRFNFPSELVIQSESSLRRKVPFEDGVVRVRTPSTFLWWFRDQTKESNQQTVRVPARLGAGLTVLHDLAVSLWGGYLYPNSIHYQSEGFFRYADAQWGHNRRDRVEWHLPEWWTLREFERWQGHYEFYAQTAGSTDDLIRAWLAAVLDVVLDRHWGGHEGMGDRRLQEDLAALAAERPERFARKYLRLSALVTISLLLAPESSCSASLAGSLAGEDGPFWSALDDALVSRIRLWRARTYADAWQRGDRTLTPALTRLLSALSPDEAVVGAIHLLRNQPVPDQTVLELLNKVKAVKPRHKERKEALESLRRSKQPGALGAAIEMAAIATDKPFKDHPINRVHDQGLVPTRADIEAQSQTSSVRGRP